MDTQAFKLSVAAFLFTAALPSTVCAQTLQVSLQGSFISEIQVGSYTVDSFGLCTGTSSGDVTTFEGQGFPAIASDNLNLASYFARNGVSDPTWEIQLDQWTNTNGSNPDFFMFELGGNDAVLVSPIMANGAVGVGKSFSNWQNTNYVVPGGLNKGQKAFGLYFGLTDLLDQNGNAVSAGTTLKALRITSSNVDGASFCAVDPMPSSGPLKTLRAPVFPVTPARVWQPYTLLVNGPTTHELSDTPNPFLDYRVQVEFTSPQGKKYNVAGYYDGNGFGKGEGSIYKVHFVPDVPGTWSYTVFLRTGTDIAVDLDPNAGTPISFVNGFTKTVQVAPRDSSAPGFEGFGRLEYVGKHYFKFRNGPYFLKSGTDSPENLLNFLGFDDPQLANSGNGILHAYGPHIADWNQGDPNFVGNITGTDARGLIGSLNYLSEQGVNSVYMLTMNLGGDANDVFPFMGATGSVFDNTHYDVSKLHQWDQVFTHAQEKGIMLHFVLGETEIGNENWLDNGNLGVERKLYYREMVARFGHHLALKWNISEENDFSNSKLTQFVDYIQAIDPYDAPVCVHNHLNSYGTYNQIFGDARYSSSSFQYTKNSAGNNTELVRERSRDNGHIWVADMDENDTAFQGVSGTNAEDIRKRVLYDIYFSGGNLEWYLGLHDLPLGGDINLEDFGTREEMWRYTRFAREFMEANLPFWDMEPADNLLSGESGSFGGGEVFALLGDVYAVYYPVASATGTINISAGGSGTYRKRWWNPRLGSFQGNATNVSASSAHSVGSPPTQSTEDWVLLFERL